MRLRIAISGLIIVVTTGVWAYQMIVPSVGVEPMLYFIVFVYAFAAAITLFRESTIESAIEMTQEAMGGDEEADSDS